MQKSLQQLIHSKVQSTCTVDFEDSRQKMWNWLDQFLQPQIVKQRKKYFGVYQNCHIFRPVNLSIYCFRLQSVFAKLLLQIYQFFHKDIRQSLASTAITSKFSYLLILMDGQYLLIPVWQRRMKIRQHPNLQTALNSEDPLHRNNNPNKCIKSNNPSLFYFYHYIQLYLFIRDNFIQLKKPMAEPVKLSLVIKKKSSDMADTTPTFPRSSSKKDTPATHESLATDLKNLGCTVTLLADCIKKLAETITAPDKQPPKNYLNQSLQKLSQESSWVNDEEEARDRKIEVRLSDGFIEGGEVNKQNIELWTAKLCQKVFSATFQKYQNDKMSIQQAKVYCSQNIINNIVKLIERIASNQQQSKLQCLKIIDQHIKHKICPYMLTKYPLAQTNIINKTLQTMIKPVDKMHSLRNNLFCIGDENCFGFEYRQSGNYNDLIMRFVNHLLQKIEQKENTQPSKQSAFEQFQKQITGIFEVVYEKAGHSCECSQQKLDRQNQKTEIKKYTSWSINRKVSQHVPRYSQTQIRNMEFQIKHPSILRILTKWCAQLEGKYHPSQSNLDSIFCKGKRIINPAYELKKKIIQELEIQHEEIKQYLQKIEANQYKQQLSNLTSSLNANFITQIDKLERTSGLFVVNTVSDLHAYIILYLNKLIHGLLRAAKNVTKSDPKLQKLDYIPNLISFTICDLMRCRITSKQKQIIKVYQKIMQKNNDSSSSVKIVKVQNRLKRNTNDILINIMFKNEHLCEIQLAVNSEQSNFMKCSNKFNHFVYQLKRSVFGPISELCSIRKSLDGRTQIYEGLAAKVIQQTKKTKTKIKCRDESQTHSRLRQTEFPFKCSECAGRPVNLSCFESHMQCEQCHNYWKCGHCKLKNFDQNDLIRYLFGKQPNGIIQKKLVKEDEQIPQKGVFFSITQKVKQYHKFVKINFKQASLIYILQQSFAKQTQTGKYVVFTKFREKKAEQQFRKTNIIFAKTYSCEQQSDHMITTEQAKQYFLKNQIQEQIYNKERQQICMIEENLTDNDCQQILGGDHSNKNKIKLIDLSHNSIINLSYLAKFTALKRLFLTGNQISSLKELSNLDKIQILFINHNDFRSFPEQILYLTNLKDLDISHNNFKSISPGINKLSHLQKLVAQNLQLTELPETINQLKSLEHVDLQGNQFKEMPEVLEIASLKILVLNRNRIGKVQNWVCKLKKLKVLQLDSNSINELPLNISKMNLQELILSNNRISKLPQSIQISTQQANLPKSLKKLDLSSNELCQINNSVFYNLLQLTRINLSKNRLSQLPASLFDKQKKLQYLNVSIQDQNKNQTAIKQYFWLQFSSLNSLRYLRISGYLIPPAQLENLRQLQNLQQLELPNMQLKDFPESIKSLKRLNMLNLSNNILSEIQQNSFDGLFELCQLDLSYNSLRDLPSSLQKCRNLTKINISNNSIAQTVLDFDNFTKITEIDTHNNDKQIISFKGKLKYRVTIVMNLTQLERLSKDQNFKQIQDMLQIQEPKIQQSSLSKQNHHVAKRSFEASSEKHFYNTYKKGSWQQAPRDVQDD